jgi:FdrA protein
MAVTKADVRSGAYYDSVVLMQLQRSLAALPGVFDAGVVMGTEANKAILAQTNLLPTEARNAGPDDLVIVVQGEDDGSIAAALGQVDELLARRRSSTEQDYLPKSLESAAQMLPNAHWVLVSVPGRYAAGVTRQALGLGKNVFLYSDNVPLEDEVALKQAAAAKGLLVMGPDCGTAIVHGVGLGFANQVRRGKIGIVAASGTGLQQVSARIHQMGGGVTHALGTGGRDLSEPVGAITARQALDLLSRDPETSVIVLVSKPPSPQVADELLGLAREGDKPVVVDFIGYAPSARVVDNLYFASTFDEAAARAVEVAKQEAQPGLEPSRAVDVDQFRPGQRYLRGLFSGGTLAYEALLLLQDYVPGVYSNVPLRKEWRLANSLVSQAHSICLLYTSPSPRDRQKSRMPSSA